VFQQIKNTLSFLLYGTHMSVTKKNVSPFFSLPPASLVANRSELRRTARGQPRGAAATAPAPSRRRALQEGNGLPGVGVLRPC
jgi:hypothetical protein